MSNRKSRVSSVIAHLPSPGRAVGTAAGDLAEQLAEQSAGQPAEQLSQLLGRLLTVQPMEKSERLGLPPESGLAPPLEVRQPPEGKDIKTSEAPLACLSLSKSRSSKGESGSGLHAPAGRSRGRSCCSLVSRRRPSAAEIPIFLSRGKMAMTTGEVVGGVVSLTWAAPWSMMGPPVEAAPLSRRVCRSVKVRGRLDKATAGAAAHPAGGGGGLVATPPLAHVSS